LSRQQSPRPHTQWTARSTDATVAVFEYGNCDADTTVVLVHGYPDDHRMYEPLIAAIGDRARVIAYDTRGGGDTVVDVPDRTSSYAIERLAEDFWAVVDSIPDRTGPVHVFAHDWGSVQMWEPLRDSRARADVASYTSVSGPSIDHLRGVSRRRGLRPWQWPSLLGQLGRSWYIWGFHVPVLGKYVPTAFVKAGPNDPAPAATPENMARGVELYRANIVRRMISGPEPRCAVPTTIVVPRRDRFLSPDLVQDVERWAPDLRIVRVEAKHWWPWTHPRDAAELLLGQA